MKNSALLCLVLAVTGGCVAAPPASLDAAMSDDTVSLLTHDLSAWEIWMGIPHTSVQGLPEGTYQADDVRTGQPLGLNADPKGVFRVIEEGGEPVLHITGEVYAGLNTRASYGDYHLSMSFRWGEQKWQPRAKAIRDSGVLYHAQGEHGAFWNVWKASLEYQVQESDFGDLICLSGPKARVRASAHPTAKGLVYDPAADLPEQATKRRVAGATEPDAPHGEWNTVELYVFEDTAIHIVNGEVVLALEGATDAAGEPLTSGQIQLQSEGAECFYKDIRLTPISELPPRYAALVGR